MMTGWLNSIGFRTLIFGGLVFVTICFGVSAVAAATEAAQPQSAPTTPAVSAASTDADAPVQAPQPSEKAMRYYRSGNVLWIIQVAWGLILPALFLFTGFSARIRDWATRLGRKWFFIVGLYFVIFALIAFVLDFPLSYYAGFVREHAYGLSNQTFAKWLGDSVKELAVSLVIGFLVIWVPYLLLRKSPRRWWLYTSLAIIPFICLMLLITPVFIEPLFNDFGPMKDKALEAKILDEASRAGIEGGRVYEVNKSVDTKTVNAYVTGFLSTKRIVLWDTILKKLDQDELLFVMGHEMGHYVLGHIPKMIALLSIMTLVTLYAIHRLSGFLIERFKARFGFTSLGDIASLPLLIMLIGLMSFVTDPITLAVSRYQERQADKFGLEITENNHAAATAFIKLQEENLSNPRPGLLFTLWRASHPSIGERVDFCNTYKPWKTGQPLAYQKYFRK
jgi:STE24 endopeptidase